MSDNRKRKRRMSKSDAESNKIARIESDTVVGGASVSISRKLSTAVICTDAPYTYTLFCSFKTSIVTYHVLLSIF